MIGRVIEIANDGRHLARSRGFMTVSVNGEEQGRIPLDDIAVLLCNARGMTYSQRAYDRAGAARFYRRAVRS